MVCLLPGFLPERKSRKKGRGCPLPFFSALCPAYPCGAQFCSCACAETVFAGGRRRAAADCGCRSERLPFPDSGTRVHADPFDGFLNSGPPTHSRSWDPQQRYCRSYPGKCRIPSRTAAPPGLRYPGTAERLSLLCMSAFRFCRICCI